MMGKSPLCSNNKFGSWASIQKRFAMGGRICFEACVIYPTSPCFKRNFNSSCYSCNKALFREALLLPVYFLRLTMTVAVDFVGVCFLELAKADFAATLTSSSVPRRHH